MRGGWRIGSVLWLFVAAIGWVLLSTAMLPPAATARARPNYIPPMQSAAEHPPGLLITERLTSEMRPPASDCWGWGDYQWCSEARLVSSSAASSDDCWGWGWFSWCSEPEAEQRAEITPPAEAEEEADPHQLFTQESAAEFATTLLTDAGITDYAILSPEENPMEGLAAVWGYPSGIMGGLTGYKGVEDVELTEASASIIDDDAANCDGDFVSGLKPSRPINKVAVRRFFTACRSGDDPMEIHYTLFKTQSGHVIQLAHIAYGDTPDHEALDHADDPFLTTAVVAEMQ